MIAQESARLDRLDAEQADARIHLAALRSELAALGAVPDIRVTSHAQPTPGVPETPAEEV